MANEPKRVVAFRKRDGVHDPAREVALDDDNADPDGLSGYRHNTFWISDGDDSKLYVYRLVPGAPGNLTATRGDREAVLEWTAPSKTGGGPIVKYEYRQKAGGGAYGDWRDIPDGDDAGGDAGDETSHRVTGLTNGTEYTFEVRAANGAGDAGEAATSNAVVPRAPTTPSAPRDLSARPGNTLATLTWKAPADDGDSRILRYEFQRREGDGPFGRWTPIPDGDDAGGDAGDETSHAATGLANGTAYTFKLRAVNAIGDGAEATSGAVVPSEAREGDLRLMDNDGNPAEREGRLEIYHDDVWGTVCDDRFDGHGNNSGNQAPAAACVLLGFPQGGRYVSGYGQAGVAHNVSIEPNRGVRPGVVPIWLDDLRCATADVPDDMNGLWLYENCNHAGWGFHNCTHEEDAGVACEGDRAASQVIAVPLTVALLDLPERHDGATAFAFRLLFSEPVATTPAAMRAAALDVRGGAVAVAARAAGEPGAWIVEVAPSSTDPVRISLAPTHDCAAAGSVCTADGRPLANGFSHFVAGPDEEEAEPGPTAAFLGMPAEHDGATRFAFTLEFSEEFGVSYATLRDSAFEVGGGAIYSARRLTPGSNLRWEIAVDPATRGDLTIALPNRACGEPGAICAGDDPPRPLANRAAATVAGPESDAGERPVATVAASAARVAEGAPAAFVVTLDRATGAALAVSLSITQTGSVLSGAPPSSASFAEGATRATVSAATEDDDADEPDGTVTATLAAGDGYAVGAPASASVTVEDDDASANRPATGAPTISGTARVGETLAASTDGIEDEDGLADAAFAHQWLRDGAAVADATGSTHALSDADEGARMSVRVSFADDAGHAESRTSAATAAVAPAEPAVEPGIWLHDASAQEDGGTLTFRVALDRTPSAPVSADYRTEDVTALAGEDYTAANGRLTIPAGRTRGTVSVAILADEEEEGAEYLLMWLSNPSGGYLRPNGEVAIGTIDDTPEASASVVGRTLTLDFGAPLDGRSVPGPRDFAVRADGAFVAVADIGIDGGRVRLTLSRAVLPGERVAVDYLPGAMHPVEYAAGREAWPFADLPAANRTVEAPTPPVEPERFLEIKAATGIPPSARIRPRGALAGFDAGLAAALGEALGDDPDGAAFAGLRALDASGRNVADLSGLARLRGLARLNLADNAVADLGPLAGLGGLRRLDLSGNRVSDLGPLAALAALERLDLSRNAVADPTPLASLPRLRVLLLDGNRIADLGALTHLSGLANLGLADNRVADVSALADLPALLRLDLSGNPLGDLSPLGDIDALVWLDVSGAPLADAAPLGRLTRLRWLWFDAATRDGPDADHAGNDGRVPESW